MKPPIDVLPLFPVLNNRLTTFLRTLSPEDWQKQTVAKKWKVKDVASHLLDGNLRRISIIRDNWLVAPETAINSNEELVEYLNTINADWVKASKRLSPALITELLESTNPVVYELFAKMDPFGTATFAVSWAGETDSFNWFDIAREYTERWLHQQQIRDALGDTGILTEELYYPLLEIFMYAWPVACAAIAAPEGTVLKTIITGNGGGEWLLQKTKTKWELIVGTEADIAAETVIGGSMAWKLFTKSIRKEEMREHYSIKGDHLLGEAVLNMVSVMA